MSVTSPAAVAEQLAQRLAKLKRERDECNADAAHWNRANPDKEPIPESDQMVDAIILDLEMKLKNPDRESGKA